MMDYTTLKGVLDGVVSENQSAFIHGRRITDNTIVGFECLHRLKRRKQKFGSMVIKLDMFKAYDRVEWCFLEKMLIKSGFLEKWVKLIMNCVSLVSYSFKLNGDICGNIVPSIGLRHGDPLYPYLFLLYAEGLSCLIGEAQSRGKLPGFICSSG
ncbi:hypothetical protein Dsin_011192 [Dipteronia sinensis]|uniref:Reverse transcriptase domain-containing protein n=1 Tax=Dipteronia sinensis TaxID=43782 RepID=A0AAE0EDT3_9ROSI|nr:hypothetical protein Dsin_011192 [Dipteronia sinensis]